VLRSEALASLCGQTTFGPVRGITRRAAEKRFAAALKIGLLSSESRPGQAFRYSLRHPWPKEPKAFAAQLRQWGLSSFESLMVCGYSSDSSSWLPVYPAWMLLAQQVRMCDILSLQFGSEQLQERYEWQHRKPCSYRRLRESMYECTLP